MMNLPAHLSAADFEARLQDGDRWIELVAGRLVRLQPPDDLHGNIVRNLAQRLAKFVRKTGHREHYCSFEVGLRLRSGPETIRCPAISCFRPEGTWFATVDQLITSQRPDLVVEVASSNDRRDAMSDRVHDYLEWGVAGVWVFDPVTRHAHVFHKETRGRMLKEVEVLDAAPTFPGLQFQVGDLFQEPAWM